MYWIRISEDIMTFNRACKAPLKQWDWPIYRERLVKCALFIVRPL